MKKLQLNFKIAGRILFTIAVISMIFLSACKKKDKDPPVLPPAGSFQMDVSNFQTGHSKAYTADGLKNIMDSASYKNWNRAVGVVWWWSTILYVNLAVPVAAYVKALENTPVQQPDDSWKWSYTVTISTGLAAGTYTANLYGKLDGDQVIWDMYLSKQGGFTDYHWYTGTSNIDGTSCSWTLQKSPLEDVNFIKIDYVKNSDNSSSIKYTYMVADVYVGSNITYGLAITTPYNAYYNLFNAQNSKTVKIEWNSSTKEGHIIDEVFFTNTNWQCWNSSALNIVCPQ